MLQLKIRYKADGEHHCTNRFNPENHHGAKSILGKHLLPDGSDQASCTNPAEQTRALFASKEQQLLWERLLIAGKFKHNLDFACS